MSDCPRVSFLVLSYNYQDYIQTTLRSILAQTCSDFEVVVVDDASTDASREVVAGFDDPRIRLLVNERNMGGAWSYNRAVQAARGEFLVNLDADDWTAPTRCERQLSMMEQNPAIDILGTHVRFVDERGRPHARSKELELWTNGDHDLNRVETWIGANHLCRSSTMVRRQVHLKIGLNDPVMVRGPDYELWTRALRMGCRFWVLPEQLTFYRLQRRGVTHVDPQGTLLELSYAMLRNLLPVIEACAVYPLVARILDWIIGNPAFATLPPMERYVLLGMILTSPELQDYTHFSESIRSPVGDLSLSLLGRRFLALQAAPDGGFRVTVLLRDELERLQSQVAAFVEDRDRWQAHAAVLAEERDRRQAEAIAFAEDRDRWRAHAAVLAEERDRRQAQAAVLGEDRDRWQMQAAVLAEDRDRWQMQAAVLGEDRDRWQSRCLAAERELARNWVRRIAARLADRRLYRVHRRGVEPANGQ